MNQQPKIVKYFDIWTTKHPEVTKDFFHNYYDAVELMENDPRKAEKEFKKIITVTGNGHLDAILRLGLLFCEKGKPIEGNALLVKAHRIASEAIPNNFNPGIDQLHWSDFNNRPILKAFYYHGLELMKEKNFEKAVSEFEFILKINPNDNQGVRYLLIECLFHLDRPADILLIDKIYPEDYSVEFLYGKFLALYLLDKKKEAKQQFLKAKKAFPFVADEIAKTKHIFPSNEFDILFKIDDNCYPVGSRQEAFDYWNTTQTFWNKANQINEFIANINTQL